MKQKLKNGDLTREKNGDRGRDGYVIDMCICIAYDFLPARIKKKLGSALRQASFWGKRRTAITTRQCFEL